MKLLLIAVTLLFSLNTQAAIFNSTFETRHETVLEEAILKGCGHIRDLTLLNVKEEIIRVDNGITDRIFTSELVGFQRLDQNIFDKVLISIVSSYSDSYDHNNQDWGVFSVESLECRVE